MFLEDERVGEFKKDDNANGYDIEPTVLESTFQPYDIRTDAVEAVVAQATPKRTAEGNAAVKAAVEKAAVVIMAEEITVQDTDQIAAHEAVV